MTWREHTPPPVTCQRPLMCGSQVVKELNLAFNVRVQAVVNGAGQGRTFEFGTGLGWNVTRQVKGDG